MLECQEVFFLFFFKVEEQCVQLNGDSGRKRRWNIVDFKANCIADVAAAFKSHLWFPGVIFASVQNGILERWTCWCKSKTASMEQRVKLEPSALSSKVWMLRHPQTHNEIVLRDKYLSISVRWKRFQFTVVKESCAPWLMTSTSEAPTSIHLSNRLCLKQAAHQQTEETHMDH